MEILFLESIDSTHTYLKNYIKEKGYDHPLCVFTNNQTNGIGSRDNKWDGITGNLYFSFVIDISLLPNDLPLQSSSIYFSYILKDELKKLNSNMWLKWPNDFYIENKKIGGTITNLIDNKLYCGIGINIKNCNYAILDIEIDIKVLLIKYFTAIEKKIKWKHIFSKYSIEFEKSREFKTTINGSKKTLKDATLNKDGSIYLDNKKVFSLR